MTKTSRRKVPSGEAASYYDRRGVLGEIDHRPVEFALEEDLGEQILLGKRVRRLKNLSIKLDEVQIIAIRKVATLKSTPYQTLIRQWLASRLREELKLERVGCRTEKRR